MSLITEAKQIAVSNNIYSAPEAQTIPFLQKIYHAMPDNHLLGVLAKDDYHTSHWYYSEQLKRGNVKNVAAWCDYKNKHGASIYFNVASRKNEVLNRKGAKGTLAELRAITCLFADIDCAIDGVAITTAYEALQAFKLKPSLIVFTGGGLQAIWVLNEVWKVDSEAESRDYKAWLGSFLQTHFSDCGVRFDSSTIDAARELRLPGYVNTKKSRNGAVASVIWENL